MNQSQAIIAQVSRGLVRGYQDLVTQLEYVAHDPTKDELDALRRTAEAASIAVIFAQDGDTPRQRSLRDRQALYVESQS